MKVFYHNDLDGHCSAAIVNHYYPQSPIDFIEVSYKDTIPLSTVKTDEKVIIVDFSFKPETMNKLLDITENVIWIDHHKTAKDYVYNKHIEGLRNFNDKAYSACALAWFYYFKNTPMPTAVTLIDDRDKWANKYNGSESFTEGLKLYPNQPTDEIWTKLFKSNFDPIYYQIIAKGQTCIQYRNTLCANYLESFSYEVVFESYTCLVVGLYTLGSTVFLDEFNHYDICIAYEYDGKQYTVGLYSQTVDVGIIAKKYGGGGHTGASGFTCKQLPF